MAKSTKSSKEDSKSRACWKDPERTKCLISLLTDQVRLGKRADSGFQKEALNAVRDQFNQKFGLKYEVSTLKCRMNEVKQIAIEFNEATENKLLA